MNVKIEEGRRKVNESRVNQRYLRDEVRGSVSGVEEDEGKKKKETKDTWILRSWEEKEGRTG